MTPSMSASLPASASPPILSIRRTRPASCTSPTRPCTSSKTPPATASPPPPPASSPKTSAPFRSVQIQRGAYLVNRVQEQQIQPLETVELRLEWLKMQHQDSACGQEQTTYQERQGRRSLQHSFQELQENL